MQIFLLIFAVTLALTMWARQKYRNTYDEELKNVMGSGITGAELARRILAVSGIEGVEIRKSHGLFADFYNPEKKRLSLAPQHFSGSTFSALGVAAHEAGHAIQHHLGHQPLFWRISAVRSTIFLSLPVALAGILMMIVPGLGKSGVLVLTAGWSFIAIGNLVTLPVELDASERSKQVLSRLKPFRNLDERIGVERVLRAASAAYVDGIFTTLSWAGSFFLPAESSGD